MSYHFHFGFMYSAAKLRLNIIVMTILIGRVLVENKNNRRLFRYKYGTRVRWQQELVFSRHYCCQDSR